MDIDKIFSAIWEGKEWIFSGIGVVALGFIGKRIIGKKSGENSDTYTVKSKMHDNNNVSGGNNITLRKLRYTKRVGGIIRCKFVRNARIIKTKDKSK